MVTVVFLERPNWPVRLVIGLRHPFLVSLAPGGKTEKRRKRGGKETTAWSVVVDVVMEEPAVKVSSWHPPRPALHHRYSATRCPRAKPPPTATTPTSITTFLPSLLTMQS